MGSFCFKPIKKIIIFCLLYFLVRLILNSLPALAIDLRVWEGWGERLVIEKAWGFYHPEIWTHHLPGFLYLLWFLRWSWLALESLGLFLSFEGWLKISSVLADIGSSWLIFKILKKNLKKQDSFWAFLAIIFYLFNPALIFNGSIWGQFDGYLNFWLILIAYLFLEKESFLTGSAVLAFTLLNKPQALPLVLIFFLTLFKNKKEKFWRFCQSFLIFILSLFLITWPFFLKTSWLKFKDIILGMGNDYPYTTLNAFNFWQLFGNWQSDRSLFAGLPLFVWGILIFLGFTFFIFKNLFKNFKKERLYLATGLIFTAFFLFATRMHERYLLPALPFLLLGGSLNQSLSWLFFYLLLSLIHFFNLYHVYSLYQPGNWFKPFTSGLVFLLSLLTIFLFFLLFIFFLKPTLLLKMEKFFLRFKKNLGLSFDTHGRYIKMINHKMKKPEKVKKVKVYLILILGFAFLSRVFLLWYPKAYIFDEVYHAFTAQEMLKGNVAAWEWWNTPPAGFAYEWTHPPLAKLIMVAGLWLGHQLGIGSDFFWWRLPAAIFGTAVIFLTYLLGKKFFLSEKIGLLAAGFLSLEGLTLVMSRVGMADIYFLFFVLLTLVFAWERRWLVTALTWGLALATKWTGIYLVLPLLLLFARDFLAKRWLGLARFLGLLLIGGVVYLVVYLPFFFSGHSFKQFRELQWQMWAYHTNLKATHNYQSPALSWPLDLRPVWFYVNYQEKAIGNIYALGNPLFFWLGFVVLPLFIYEAWRSFSKKMIFLVLLYLVFWVPWIFSPRIMFLYHYLPSLPFLAMILSWMIVYFENIFKIKWLSLVCLGVVLLGFIWLYPLFTGILVPKNFLPLLFWLPSWK